MPELILTIGDKNLSSWSLRPWVLLKHLSIPFTEENIKLDQPETRKILRDKSPSGFVPFLNHGEISIWDSLAIAEYINELFPEKQLWPENPAARAIARSVSAEMHSGFSALRTVWPMQFTREGLRLSTAGGVQHDIDRINHIWTQSREQFGKNGDFLFGKFSIADAIYAPVISRFSTYGPLELSSKASGYMETMMALPAMMEWGKGASSEIA